MATISAGDLTLLRTNNQKATPYLSVMQPAILLSATVTGTPARGARSISYNSGTSASFATIGEGQTVVFVTALGQVRIRLKSISGTASSGTLTIDENGLVLTNGDAIIIYHNYEVYPIPPAIRSGVFYKFYNVAYSDQNEEPSPVAIAGSHRAGFLSGGSIVFNLAGGSSYAVASGATISNYSWACVHNGGGTSGITIASPTSATTTLTITEADTYWLSLTVTDSNGQTMTTYRAIFIHDTASPPYIDFTIQSLTGDWSAGGWRLSISITGDADLTEFPDWTLVVLWYVNYFNATEDYVNLWGVSDNIITCGYLRSDSDRDSWENGTGEVTFQITTIDDLLNNVSQLGSVSLNAVASPGFWYQYASWMTTGRSIHHLLRWQAWGVFQACDVYGLTDNSLGVLNTDYTESGLMQQVNNFSYNRGIFAKLICDRLGRLHLVRDSQMLNTAERAALDTVFTITEADISSTVDVVRSPEQNITFTQLDGFSFNGSTSTPFISIIPGYRESSVSYIIPELRGGGTAAVNNQVLGSQTDANERVGRYQALQNNNPRELRFALPSNYLGAFDIVPSIGWYEWGIADADLKRDTELNGKLFVCRNITHQFNYGDSFTGIIQTSIVIEPEAIGPDGIQGNYPLGYPSPVVPTPQWTPPDNPVVTATYGYWGGGASTGSTHQATTDRITFSTSITALNTVSNLSQARRAMATVSDLTTYGYFAGGFSAGSVVLATADRITFSTGVTAANTVSNLTAARDGAAGLSSGSAYGYFIGGKTAANALGSVTTADRITFSTEATAANTASNLSLARTGIAGVSNRINGYIGGGGTSIPPLPPVFTALTDIIVFSTGITSANTVSNLSVAKSSYAACSDQTNFGYFAGGETGVGVATTDRLAFSTGITAASTVSDLSQARYGVVGLSQGSTYGYFAGGITGIGTLVATADRIVFSTSVTSSNTASNLSIVRALTGGLSDGAV